MRSSSLLAGFIISTLVCLSLMQGVSSSPTNSVYNSTSQSPRWEVYPNGTSRLGLIKCCNGAVMKSYTYYFHGRFTASIRLHKGFSAGVVTTYYLRSHGKYWDEIDFEFLGHTTGKNIIVHTNYFAQGSGGKEEQIKLWFDPSASYHNYTIWWTWNYIAWYVDDVMIRLVERPSYAPRYAPGFVNQPMLGYGSIWDGSGWATNGGTIKTDYTKAPFFIYYGGMDYTETCPYVKDAPCTKSFSNSWDVPITTEQRNKMMLYRRKYLVFSYLYPRMS